MEWFGQLAATMSGFVWGTPLIVLLFGTHLYMTVRTGFIQRHLFKALKISFTGDKGADGDVSQFGALMVALAATIGTGNIMGVAGAIAVGGPGAVLWMWLTGVFGMATKYAEAILAVTYRVKMPDGSMAGGPMYALEIGMKQKWLGVLFAIFTCVAAFGIGNMTQANSLIELAITHFGEDQSMMVRWIGGLAIAGLTALVILGGVQSISRVCTLLVPVMAIVYVLGCIAVLIHNFAALPQAFVTIFQGAWSGQAALGGFVGAGLRETMQAGIARGLFSNESGLGSAPIVAAAAQTKNPLRQALVSMTGTFWDTVVVCLMTGLVIVSSGHWTEGLPKAHLTSAAFGDLSAIGPAVLVFGLATFVFSTILGWSYYGEKAAEYLFGPRSIKPYRYLWVLAALFGSVQPAQAVWDFADAANGLMAIPNLISLLALSSVIARAHTQYEMD